MNTQENNQFLELGISGQVVQLLNKNTITTPTPIQVKTIPLALAGKDVIGIAQTGTGKTFAFGLPALEKIKNENQKCLVLLPTRELAQQVFEALFNYSKHMHIKIALLIGGTPYPQQMRQLRQKPDIIIATPGRLKDHLQKKTINGQLYTIVVLDEADRMLDIGFLPDIKKIFTYLPTKRQTLLFTATLSPEIKTLTNELLHNPEHIEVAPQGTSNKNISQSCHIVQGSSKKDALLELLSKHEGNALIFTRTKIRANKFAQMLSEAGFSTAQIHSNKTLSQRKQALQGFKNGKYKLLVATDIAARGIHVDDIKLVINLDLPDCIEDYVHRIGRTGRAGKSGNAISFIEPHEGMKLRKIEKLVQCKLDVIGDNTLITYKESPKPGRSRNNRNFSRNRNFNKSFNRNNSFRKFKPKKKAA